MYKKHELQEGWKEFAGQVEWEVFVTLNFTRNVGPSFASREAKVFIRNIAKDLKTQIPGFIVFNQRGNPHLHLLLIGDKVSLECLAGQALNRPWRYGSVDIRLCDNGGSGYFASNVTPHIQEDSDVTFYGMKMLKKLLCKRATIMTMDDGSGRIA
jgi:hypothetical protein